MQITNDSLEERLEHWAKWAAKSKDGLGYPSVSVEYRLLVDGAPTRQKGKQPVASNPLAEEMDALVCELRQHFEEKAEIIKSYYLDRSNTFKMADIIVKHKLPYREFYRELRNAKDMLRLLIALRSKENNKFKKIQKAA